MNAYIYNVETSEVIATIAGENNQVIEDKANELGYMGVDEYGLSYTLDGLELTTHSETHEAELE